MKMDKIEQTLSVGGFIAHYLAEIGVTTVFGVISIHNMPILDAMATQGRIRFVPARGEAGERDEGERAALAYCDAMTQQVHVPDDVAKAVRDLFPPRQLVELTATIAGYNCVSRVLEALEIKGSDPLPPG